MSRRDIGTSLSLINKKNETDQQLHIYNSKYQTQVRLIFSDGSEDLLLNTENWELNSLNFV